MSREIELASASKLEPALARSIEISQSAQKSGPTVRLSGRSFLSSLLSLHAHTNELDAFVDSQVHKLAL